MAKQEKMWALMMYLTHNMWRKKDTALDFDDEVWDQTLKECSKNGINTILLDVGDGIQYGSHPEISIEGAWSKQRVHREVKKAADMGIAIIPKLNFSTTHDFWLGEYERMISTNTYYKVMRDLILEVYEAFDHPKYIHLGMDEEDARHQEKSVHVSYRQGELIWHDLQFMFDCVRETGATPWIWSDFLFNHPDEFMERIGTEDIVLSPWNYDALKEEHYTPFNSRPKDVFYYTQWDYASLSLKYVEDDPFLVRFREQAIPNAKKGFKYVPCASTYTKCVYNTPDLVWYFKEKAPDDSIVGYMTAPWVRTTAENMDEIKKSIALLKAAKDEFYPEG